MNYSIDKHTKREKQEEKVGDKMVPIIVKDKSGKPIAKVNLIKGFILRADDAFVGFYKTKGEAMAQMEKEKKTPSVVPGQPLTIESHTKREKQFDKDDKPIMEDGKVKIVLTRGFNLRSGNRVMMFSEDRSELVKLIQGTTGISDPVKAEESVKPQKPAPKRARRTG